MTALLPPRATVAPDFALEPLSLPMGLGMAPGCGGIRPGGAFLGGVLMGDDSVLAIPDCADHFIRIDVGARVAQLIGPRLPPSLGADGGVVTRFGGGVLACDGSALALPRGFDGGLRVWLDGGVEPLGLPGRTQGGVLTGRCTAPTLSYGDFEDGARGGLYFDVPLDGGSGRRIPVDSHRPNGHVRSSAGEGWAVHAERSALEWRVDLLGPPLPSQTFPQSNTMFRTPSVWTAGGAALSTAGEPLVVDATTGAIVFWATTYAVRRENDAGQPSQPLQWPVTRGDGFIYALNNDGLWIYEDTHQGRTELRRIPVFGINPQPFAGLVAHPSGVLVAIPWQVSAVWLLVPDGGVTAPGEVLRSPYFNKL